LVRRADGGKLDYAAEDATSTRDVYPLLGKDIATAELGPVRDLEERCLPAVLWLMTAGVAFDKDAWLKLADEAAREAQTLKEQLSREAPPKPDGSAWNFNSPKQVTALFGLLGVTLDSTAVEALAQVPHPFAQLLVAYRQAHKRATTYGPKWLDHVGDDGRIRCSWKQTGPCTGRMSSKDRNLQNLPRNVAYRRCFIAPPHRILIKADYSQIELRISAKVAKEKNMSAAFLRGEDLHTLTARKLTGRQEITPQERSLAKPVNFGLIYGLSPATLARKVKAEAGIEMSIDEAKDYCAAWFAAWPGIARWHTELKRLCWRGNVEVRTLTGRRILIPNKPWHGKAGNYIVQGSGGDGIKAALALLWERREQCPHALPVLAVHDEIVIEADEDKAPQAAAWLKAAMLDGMRDILAPLPCEVEITIAPTWGGPR
jgi:DNA polymerase-1